jgi:hypothetical protein
MAIYLFAFIALGIVIFSGLYIWFMNKQWYRQNTAQPPAPPASTQSTDRPRA